MFSYCVSVVCVAGQSSHDQSVTSMKKCVDQRRSISGLSHVVAVHWTQLPPTHYDIPLAIPHCPAISDRTKQDGRWSTNVCQLVWNALYTPIACLLVILNCCIDFS